MPHATRCRFSALAGVVGAGMLLAACTDLVPGNPVIPDLNEIYKQARTRPDGKLMPPVLSGMTIVNPYPGPNVPIPQFSALPGWPQGVTPPEPVTRYLLRQRNEGGGAARALTEPQPTAELFPGLSGRFDMILPKDLVSEPTAETGSALDSQDFLWQQRFAQNDPVGAPGSPVAGLNPADSLTATDGLSALDSLFAMERLPAGADDMRADMPPRRGLVAVAPQEGDAVIVNYDALQEAAARAAQDDMAAEEGAVSVDFAQLETRRSCPLPQAGAAPNASPGDRSNVDALYGGFNAETVRFAWEDEPIAAATDAPAGAAGAGAMTARRAPSEMGTPLETMRDKEIKAEMNQEMNHMNQGRAPAEMPGMSDMREMDAMPSAALTDMPDMMPNAMPERVAPQVETQVETMARASPPPASAPAPAAAPFAPVAGEKRYHAYFDFASARLSPKVLALTEMLATTYARRGGHIQLIGHAGAPQANQTPQADAFAVDGPAQYVGGSNLSLERSRALRDRLVGLGVTPEHIQLVESDRRPAAFDALPNIEIYWRPAAHTP